MKHEHHRYGFLLSYVDMLYAVLASFLCLFVLLLVMINAQHKPKTGEVVTDAQLQIVMSWTPDGVANDIDLWVRPPDGVPIGYSRLQNTYMYLSRDDLGKANDFAIINGKKELILGHTEVTSIRKLVPGHYEVNSMFFTSNLIENADHPEYSPTQVTVKLIQVNPYKVIVSRTYTMINQGDQHTAFQFDIEQNGTIDGIITDKQDPFVTGNGSQDQDTRGIGRTLDFPNNMPGHEHE